MHTHGTLKKWNDERGFGFIETPLGEELFVHVSAFPRDGIRPRVGEMLAFDVQAGNDGKRRAEKVSRPGSAHGRHRRRSKSSAGRSWSALEVVLLVAALAAIAGFAYKGYVARHRNLVATEASVSAPVTPAAVPAGYKCDGRTHCSQMRSCDEARFFLKHCPDVKMDGNGDGEPCEQQWCN